MKIVPFHPELSLKNTIVSVGTFDGLHIGHQKIFETLHHISKKQNCQSVVVTFNPHPRHFLNPDQKIALLTSLEEKVYLFQNNKFCPDVLVVIPFNQSIASLSGKDFLTNIIQKHLNPKGVVIGYDHHFGKNREASKQETEQFCRENHLSFSLVEAEKIGNDTVSSTMIRNSIAHDEIAKANQYLGYFYGIHGQVVEGDKRGKTLGFPTANLSINDEATKLIPPNGVYAVLVSYQAHLYYAVANVGLRPTVSSQTKPSIEIHLLDFDKNIYHEELKVFFVEKIRNEQRFSNLEELKSQITKDCEKGLTILQKTKRQGFFLA